MRLELARFSAFLLFKEPSSQMRRSDACGLAFFFWHKNPSVLCVFGLLPTVYRLRARGAREEKQEEQERQEEQGE